MGMIATWVRRGFSVIALCGPAGASAGTASAAPATWKLEHSSLSTDLFEVGSSSPASVWSFGFGAQRWTSAGWRTVSTSGLGTDRDLWSGVDESASDVWAVGQSPTGPSGRGMIARWDGRSWKLESRLGVTSGLRSISRVPGTNHLWAVGWRASGGTSVPLIEHRVAHWRSSPAPSVASGILNGVASVSPTETWAVGDGPSGALAERWNGASWSISAVPNSQLVSLQGVAAVPGTTRVLAVGYREVGGDHRPVAYLWSGRRWSAMPIDVGSQIGELDGVVSIRPGYAWTVGTTGFQASSLVEHWTLGPSWHRVPSPTPSGGCGLTLHSIAKVPLTGGPTLWAVGDDGCGAVATMRYR